MIQYYDTILIIKYGRKAQRNNEAYTTWAFHAKLLRINLTTERQRQSNNNTKEKGIKKRSQRTKLTKKRKKRKGVKGNEQVK